MSRRSELNSDRPSSRTVSPPSYTWTVTDPATTSSSIRQTGCLVLARADFAEVGGRLGFRGRRGPDRGPGAGADDRHDEPRRCGRAAVHGERDRQRGRPDDRPGLRGDADPDPMPGQPAIAHGPQWHVDLLDPAGDQRLRVLVGMAVGEVEDARAHLGRGPVRCDVGEADDDRGDLGVGRQVEDRLGEAEGIERSVQGFGGIGQAERLVGAQVAGEAVRGAACSP